MAKQNSIKLSLILSAIALVAASVQARPEYLRLFNADPLSRPELRGKCSVCHTDAAGGGDRNAFGQAFEKAGLKITPELRRQFPTYFVADTQSERPAVSFAQNDHEATVEINGKRYRINTRDKTVTEIAAVAIPADKTIVAAPRPTPTPEPAASDNNVYRAYDVRLVNLPTAMPIAKGALWSDFTHRFPFGDPVSGATLLGLDNLAYPSFGFTYGITDRIQVGAYRSPTDLGRPIQLHVGLSALDEQKGDPMSVLARVALEGRDNFQRNFATSLELTFARSITKHAQLYVVPTITLGDRPLNVPAEENAPGETAFALGIGGALNIRPTVALMAEANYRLNDESRYRTAFSGIRRPVVGFGIQKVSASRRHAFTLTFSNGPGTTFSQRSQTRGVLGSDDGLHGLTIGFNLSRRLF